MINELLEQQACRIYKEAVVIMFGIIMLSLLLAILFTWLESKSKYSYRGIFISHRLYISVITLISRVN